MMKSSRMVGLQLAHVQMQLQSEKQQASKEVKAHLTVIDTLKGATAAGERERVALAKSLERLRLSKVIDALRRVNAKDDFNDALEDLLCRLRKISEIVTALSGVTIRNMRLPDMNVFVEELQELNEVWQKFDEAEIQLSSFYQEMKDVREKMRDLNEKLRSLVIQQKIADAI